MQKDDVRHHRSTQDTNSQQHAISTRELRYDTMKGNLTPIGSVKERLQQVAARNHSNQRGNYCLEMSKATALQTQDDKGRNSGENSTYQQRDMEEQVKANCRPQKFSQVGSHGYNLRKHPHPPHERSRKLLPTNLREIPSGRNSQFSR